MLTLTGPGKLFLDRWKCSGRATASEFSKGVYCHGPDIHRTMVDYSTMTKEEARQIALRFLIERESKSGIELALLDDQTLERDFCWVFFYNSQRYLESRDFRDMLAGNAPIVVTKIDGRIHVTGTGQPLEQYLQKF